MNEKPCYSRKSGWIYFCDRDPGTGETIVYRVRIDGTRLQRLT